MAQRRDAHRRRQASARPGTPPRGRDPVRERRRRVVLAMILVFGLAGVLVLVAPGDGDGAPVAPPEHTPGAAVG